MIYNSFNFIIVFPFIFLLYYIIPGKFERARNGFLLVTSYLLYLNWKPVYALILFGVTLITFYGAKLLEKSNNHRKLVLNVSVFFTILPLLFFKYFNFANEIIFQVLSFLGVRFNLVGLNWAVPIGISFFTFQALGYLWDVYYRKIESEKNFFVYSLFVSFFPSILSGPINKASLILPQLHNLRKQFDYPKIVEGLKFLLWGMFMKTVVADRAGLYVDTILPNYMNYTGISCLVAVFFYTVQIYADFAGYSLMAIGVGKTLGFELTENFRRPYFSFSVTDFWRRWHISLSTWLKDYVYIPLGGSRCTKSRNYLNILITFLVSGIWHGANWTFIIWGLLHGVFQVVEKMLGQQMCDYKWLGKTIKILVTFVLVSFAWIFFRMPTLSSALGVIKRIFDVSLPKTIYTGSITVFSFMLLGTLILFIKDFVDEFLPSKLKVFNNSNAFVRWLSYIACMISIMLAGVFSADQFIYANF